MSSVGSRKIARRYPLRAAAIGWCAGRTLIARQNWDIVEVRDLAGVLWMRHEVALEGELLLHSCHFVGERHLVVEVGGGVMAAGFRAWDLDAARWVATVDDHWDDTSVVGADDTRGLVAVSDGRGVDLVGVATGATVARLQLTSPSSIAFHPTVDGLIAASGDAFMLDPEGMGDAGITALLRAGEVRAHRPANTDGAGLAWLDAEQLAVLAPDGTLELVECDLRGAKRVGAVAADARLRASHGRWLLVHAAHETIVIDTHTGAHRAVPGVAYVPPDGVGIAWATSDRAGTEPL